MRLIDADELMKDIIRRFGCKPYIEVGLICEYVHDIIDSQPTAFDVESAIEQLEEKIEITWKHDYMGGRKDAFTEAINIIKKGVVE